MGRGVRSEHAAPASVSLHLSTQRQQVWGRGTCSRCVLRSQALPLTGAALAGAASSDQPLKPERTLMRPLLRAAEYVFPGHPDKLCDAIADALVQEAGRRERRALCGVEVAVHRASVFVTGRIACRD